MFCLLLMYTHSPLFFHPSCCVFCLIECGRTIPHLYTVQFKTMTCRTFESCLIVGQSF
jgi:hypothetical protein